jgi:hypothetical protein
VKKLLLITKLNGIFKVFDSIDELDFKANWNPKFELFLLLRPASQN